MSVRLRACACVYAWTCVYVCTNVTVWISLRVPLWSCIGLCVTTVWLNLIAYFDVLHPSWNHLVEFRANHLKSDEINFAHVCWTCCSFLRQFPPETSSSISPTSGTRLRSTVYRTAIAPSGFLLTPQPVRPNKTDLIHWVTWLDDVPTPSATWATSSSHVTIGIGFWLGEIASRHHHPNALLSFTSDLLFPRADCSFLLNYVKSVSHQEDGAGIPLDSGSTSVNVL